MTTLIDAPVAHAASRSPVMALAGLLDELAAVLRDVPPSIYTACLIPGVSGSIGQHVRHCLDHVSALLRASAAAPLSYDRRERGTDVETDLAKALERIARLNEDLAAWSLLPLDIRIRVRALVSGDEEVTGGSTLARELAFVVSHTIHHHATIAVLLAMHGCRVPERFGHAPSTPSPR